MSAASTKTAVQGDIVAMARSFALHLSAENKADRTRTTYALAIDQLTAFLSDHGMPTDVAKITREHIETFIAGQVARNAPATAAQRFRSLQQFFKWLESEGEVTTSPMARMRAPAIPEVPVPVLSDAQLSRLLKACEGSDFESRRDTAIVRVFLDTGARISEVTGLTLDDLWLEAKQIRVMGKGSHPRALPVGRKTVRALDRYLRSRARHKDADDPALWLGDRGPLTDSGIRQMVKRRARQAEIGHIHPHQFRHTFAHGWQSAGGNEADLMAITGWKSRQMVLRYASSAAAQRAALAHERLSPGDRL